MAEWLRCWSVIWWPFILLLPGFVLGYLKFNCLAALCIEPNGLSFTMFFQFSGPQGYQFATLQSYPLLIKSYLFIANNILSKQEQSARIALPWFTESVLASLYLLSAQNNR